MSLQSRLDGLGLRALFWCSGTPNPSDLIARDASGGISFHRADSKYDFDGWEPWADDARGCPMNGGRLERFEAALGWYGQALAIRAGQVEHF
jgi:hypothetical protein